MTFKYTGKCSCGSIKVTFHIPEKIENFTPRACDCDFCTSRKIEYLSHPDGLLLIENSTSLIMQKQGSNQAEFITCYVCEQVIAASFEFDNNRIGALNSRVLDAYTRLIAAEIVSPKVLSDSEKIERWKSVWTPIKMVL